jgi:hypothetical protein
MLHLQEKNKYLMAKLTTTEKYQNVISKLLFEKKPYSELTELQQRVVLVEIEGKKEYIRNSKLVKLKNGKVILIPNK